MSTVMQHKFTLKLLHFGSRRFTVVIQWFKCPTSLIRPESRNGYRLGYTTYVTHLRQYVKLTLPSMYFLRSFLCTLFTTPDSFSCSCFRHCSSVATERSDSFSALFRRSIVHSIDATGAPAPSVRQHAPTYARSATTRSLIAPLQRTCRKCSSNLWTLNMKRLKLKSNSLKGW